MECQCIAMNLRLSRTIKYTMYVTKAVESSQLKEHGVFTVNSQLYTLFQEQSNNA